MRHVNSRRDSNTRVAALPPVPVTGSHVGHLALFLEDFGVAIPFAGSDELTLQLVQYVAVEVEGGVVDVLNGTRTDALVALEVLTAVALGRRSVGRTVQPSRT